MVKQLLKTKSALFAMLFIIFAMNSFLAYAIDVPIPYKGKKRDTHLHVT